ncbi:hypothetical protein [Salinibacter ruber]|uniref:Uncharacterized protein n=1 Tax=Salinibacter ruber TaxID=146919 RepID=A0A9X2ZZ94_9BACT|nr:hypothetical protein [Salinibacter ruber]MCS3616301.1 hypothetical protein [Salinibacter ruber]MCS4037256.1 hypothetical protein [Salinibacter ruber]
MPNGNQSQEDDLKNSRHEVLDAFEQRWKEEGKLPFSRVVMEGIGPFGLGDLWIYLRELGAKVQEVGNISDPDLLVVGREKVGLNDIRQLLKKKQGERLRICSQEMLLAWAMTGVDPNSRPETADTFVDEHPILTEITDLLEGKWPGTEPIPYHGNSEGDIVRPDTSPLGHLGYSVGHSGENRARRREALRKGFKMEKTSLPGEYSTRYIEKWGPAESGARLKRIADHIATHCRNNKNNPADYDLAIEQWEADLGWLKKKYYSPLTYGFTWPETA